MTNIFIFETSPNTKLKEKKVEGAWHIMSPCLKKWVGLVPHQIVPMQIMHIILTFMCSSLVLTFEKTFCMFFYCFLGFIQGKFWVFLHIRVATLVARWCQNWQILPNITVFQKFCQYFNAKNLPFSKYQL